MENICKSPYYQELPHACLSVYPKANEKYQEILRLQKMLEENNIPHAFGRWMDGWMVCYPVARPSEECVIDAIEMSGSYGRERDLIEIMGLLTPEEEECDAVAGYLTAENVLERIKKHWEENKEEDPWEDYVNFIKRGNIVDEIVLDEFEEVGEFDMPLEKDSIMNVDISNELKLLERFGCCNE